MPGADLPANPRKQAEILDIIDKVVNNTIYTKGGLELTTNNMDGIYQCVTQPVTQQGEKTLSNAINYYEMNLKGFLNGKPVKRKYAPVTTLAVESPPIATGGKRNKSKKPKRRNSRSKRRKTLGKR